MSIIGESFAEWKQRIFFDHGFLREIYPNIWKIDNDQYSRFIVDGYAPDDDAVAHNFITRDGYSDILEVPTVVVIQGPLYNDEATTLPSVLTVGVGPVKIFHNGDYIQGTWRLSLIHI